MRAVTEKDTQVRGRCDSCSSDRPHGRRVRHYHRVGAGLIVMDAVPAHACVRSVWSPLLRCRGCQRDGAAVAAAPAAQGSSAVSARAIYAGRCGEVIVLPSARPNKEESYETWLAHLDPVCRWPADRRGGGVALAQEPDTKWLVGTWRGSMPSPAGMGQTDRVELIVKGDATFEGDTQSARGGLLSYRKGSWKATGETVVLDATIQGGPGAVNGSAVKWTLKRSGDDLEGTIHRSFNNTTTPATFKKAK